MATPKQWKRRSRWSLIIGTLFAALAFGAVLAYADNVTPDGDTSNPGNNIVFQDPSPNQQGCADRGSAVTGTITVTYNGSSHFSPNEAVTVTLTPDDPGIVATYTPTNVPAVWNTNGQNFNIPISTTVAASVSQGVHTVTVHLVGATSGYVPNDKSYNVTIDTTCPVASAGPTVDAGGPYSGNEGSAISLSGASVTGGGANPVYSWSVDTNASISGDTAGDSGISCTFSPSNAVLNPSVTCNDDSNGGHFTLTLSYTDDTNTTPTTDTAQLTVSNVAPTVSAITGDTSVNEDPSATHTYTYTITDPGTNDTQTVTADCGTADGAAVSAVTTTSFKCTFPDGEKPANISTISVYSTDDDGDKSNTPKLDVTVSNVAPTVSDFSGNITSTNCTVSISSISATDPGQAYDNTYTGSIDWGEGSPTSLSAASYGVSSVSWTGPFSHTYSTAGSHDINVTATDGDNDTGTATKVTINNSPNLTYPEPPIIAGKTFNTGSSIPVKILVTGCTAGLNPVIYYQVDPDTTHVTPNPSGKSSKIAGNMRYDATLPGFIYNWQTKGLAPGIYTIYIMGLPGTIQYAVITLVK